MRYGSVCSGIEAATVAVLLAAVTEIAARNEDAECIREARRALEADHHLTTTAKIGD